jgi:hypothetical protein
MKQASVLNMAALLLLGDYLSDRGQRKEFYLALGAETGLREFADHSFRLQRA